MKILKAVRHRVRDYVNGEGQTLHEAAKKNNIRRVFHLLDGGEDVNAKDEHGLTALHMACWYNYKDLVRLLLERGADINSENKEGKTSLTLAKQKGNVQVVFLLEDVLSRLEMKKEPLSTVMEEKDELEEKVPKAIKFPSPASIATAPTTSTGSISAPAKSKARQSSAPDDDHDIKLSAISEAIASSDSASSSSGVAKNSNMINIASSSALVAEKRDIMVSSLPTAAEKRKTTASSCSGMSIKETDDMVSCCSASEAPNNATMETSNDLNTNSSLDIISLSDGVTSCPRDDILIASGVAAQQGSSSVKSLGEQQNIVACVSKITEPTKSQATSQPPTSPPYKFKTRVALDSEIERCRKAIDLANGICSDEFFAQAVKAADHLFDQVLPLRSLEEYATASELKEKISSLEEQITRATFEDKPALTNRLLVLKHQCQCELEAEQELRVLERGNRPPPMMQSPASAPQLPVWSHKDLEEGATPQRIYERRGASSDSIESSRAMRYDSLTVFQAKPLVWFDKKGSVHPMDAPDFEKEKRKLLSVVEEAKEVGGDIQIIFEEASVDRLGAFLATSISPVLHFSCHGHPDYLAIENKGALQPLHVDQLSRFISSGRGHLKMVFVSACYSRRAGEAFLKAGVKHVVCCKTNEQLRDSASIVFEEHFYRALASGRTLKAAFDLARYMVQVTPSLGGDPLVEKGEFLLLPEKTDDDPYHDVNVFYTTPMSSVPTSMLSRPGPNINLPPQPTGFIGRQVPLYNLVNDLALEATNPRLILIKGAPGIGKVSLAQAACSYIGDRSRTFNIYDCEWVPLVHCAGTKVSMMLHHLYNKLEDDQVFGGADFRSCVGDVVKAVKTKCALIVIDARQLTSEIATKKLDVFLYELIRWTSFVRVMIVCPADRDFLFRPRCLTVRLLLGPLDMRSSVLLFGNYCDHVGQRLVPGVSSSEDLARLLVPETFSNSAKSHEIFHLVGDGNPARTLKAATEITEQNYIKLIRAGIVQLEETIALVSHKLLQVSPISKAEWEYTLKELHDFRETLPALLEL